MNIAKVRQDFPLLKTKIKGKPIIYFDNACQTLRSYSVIAAINDYYQNYSACTGRSVHKLSAKVTEKCEEARKTIARFIGAKKKEEIIFVRNTTEGINLIAYSLGLQKGDVVLITDKEHNSNLIPWQILSKKNGIIYQVIPSRKDNTFDLGHFKKIIASLRGRVKLVSMGLTSNLDGTSIPAREIVSISHKYGSKVLLDAAQAAPHYNLSVHKLDVDFLAFSGHKMLGPSGVGVLYGKYHLLKEIEPFLVGGDTVRISTYKTCEFLPPPEKFEAGLQNYAGIIGLGEAVKYIEKIGIKNIIQQEQLLNKYVTEELLKIPRIKIIGPLDASLRGGIVSFYMPGIDVHQIALLLDETANIMVRSGQHCVHSWFNAQRIPGSVRASFYFYNTKEETELFVATLNNLLKIIL